MPWANTQRSYRQGVHFHVNPGYSLNKFLADWTAPHELSHLLLPYLGNSHSWFAEGFASYMQYQIMQAMDILTPSQVRERYRRNITRASNKYNLKNVSFINAAPLLRARRDHPTMYWGGAVYFLQADQALRVQGSSLIEIISDYVTCCRYKRNNLDELIRELDRLSGNKIFTDQFFIMKTRPGFPDSANLF